VLTENNSAAIHETCTLGQEWRTVWLQPGLAEKEFSDVCVLAECARRSEISGESYPVFDYKRSTMQPSCAKEGEPWPS
jgi:hypothetical protein